MDYSQYYIETRFYKNERYAILKVLTVLFAVAGIFVLFLFSNSTVIPVIVLILLFLIPIVSSFKKTWFSLNAYDNRILKIKYDEVILGNLSVPLHEVSELQLYLRSYDGLALRAKTGIWRNSYVVNERGNENKLSFEYRNQLYHMTFLLKNHEVYFGLIDMALHWEKKYKANVKHQFTYKELESGYVEPGDLV